MASEPNQQATNRPYPPPSTVISVLQRVRSRNLPDRIDAEYLRDAGVTDSLNARTLFALRFLRFVSEDRPTNTMRAIATSTDEEYRSILADALKEAYQDVFNVIDPEQDSQDRILNFFRRYMPASQRPRMVTFFVGMCKEAGIQTVDAQKNRLTTATGATRPTSAQSANRPISRPTFIAADADRIRRQADMPGVMSPALELLVRSLPPAGTPMSQARREQWIEMARATLAYIYPDAGDEATTHKQEEKEEA